MVGHIKLERKILDWEWYQDANVFRLFIHLLLTANYKNGKWQGHAILRGQLITGLDKLSSNTGLSIMQIRTCFDKLKLTGEITVIVTSKFRIVTICKYNTYQSFKQEDNNQDNTQINNQVTGKQQTDNKPITANNKDNNNKEDNKDNKLKDAENPFLWFLRYYHEDYIFYKAKFNGQSTTEKMFIEWKSFIDFIYENGYEEVFNCKFITPHDYGKLYKNNNFSKKLWDTVLKKLLSTGIKPEHNLFFRIPDFIDYSKKQNDTSKAKIGSIGETIEFDKS